MPKKLKIGIIGSGGRGLNVLGRQFMAHADQCEVVAVSDPAIESVRKKFEWVLREAGEQGKADIPEPASYQTHQELMDKHGRDLDLAMVCSPNQTHAEIMQDICPSGVSIFLEKPIATTREDCDKIEEAVAKGKNRVYVGFVMRHNDMLRKLYQTVQSGELGQIKVGMVQDTYELGRGYFRGRNRFIKNSGGLCVEKSCHTFDLIAWLTGDMPVSVQGVSGLNMFKPRADAAEYCSECSVEDCYDRMGKRRSEKGYGGTRRDLCIYNSEKEIHDHALFNFTFKSGMKVSYGTLYFPGRTERRFDLYGPKGQVDASVHEKFLEIRRPGNQGNAERTDFDYAHLGHSGADVNMIENVIDVFQNNKPVPCKLDEAMTAMRMAFAAEKCAKTGITEPV